LSALRRPQQLDSQQPALTGAVGEPHVGRPYPRWLVISGLIAYCAAFWVLVVVAGTWGVELIRTATAQP
jgi:hypothetical protein